MKTGVYQLLIEIKDLINTPVGALGLLTFPKGFYVYTGSAMNNVYKRVERHLSSEKKLHWHIDYLLNNDKVNILDTKIIETTDKIECKLNQMMHKKTGAKSLYKKFGSGDCTKCNSHLIKLKFKKDFYR